MLGLYARLLLDIVCRHIEHFCQYQIRLRSAEPEDHEEEGARVVEAFCIVFG
jgi:hypothetical protein